MPLICMVYPFEAYPVIITTIKITAKIMSFFKLCKLYCLSPLSADRQKDHRAERQSVKGILDIRILPPFVSYL
jgi:hypothetical protein